MPGATTLAGHGAKQHIRVAGLFPPPESKACRASGRWGAASRCQRRQRQTPCPCGRPWWPRYPVVHSWIKKPHRPLAPGAYISPENPLGALSALGAAKPSADRSIGQIKGDSGCFIVADRSNSLARQSTLEPPPRLLPGPTSSQTVQPCLAISTHRMCPAPGTP